VIFDVKKRREFRKYSLFFCKHKKLRKFCVTFFVRYFLFLKKYKKLREKRVIEFVRHFLTHKN